MTRPDDPGARNPPARLGDAERFHREMIERASEVFYQVAVDDDPFRGTVHFVSPQCEQLTGFTPSDFLADSSRWVGLIHPEDLPVVARSTQSILQRVEPGTRIYRLRDRDGSYRHIEDRVVPVTDERGRVIGYQGAARDVTERVRAEEERNRMDARIRRGEKLELMGRLAGGIAHDFNNVLTIILTSCDVALSSEPGHEAEQDLQDIARAARRATELTRRLLALGRGGHTEVRGIDLAQHMRGLLDMIRRIVTEKVRVVMLVTPDLGMVHAEPSQIDQILINLAANARDAMPNGGVLQILAENVTVGPSSGVGDVIVPGDYIRLSVQDDGEGMDRATLAKIFDPFFTTKSADRGSGMGLTSVQEIVTQNGGFLSVESEPGRGTTVQVHLPREEGLASNGEESGRQAAGGHETVLLVEDDEGVRTALRRLLASLGYHVIEAESASRALAICESRSVHIDVILSDVVLPDMDGGALARVIRSLKPDIGVLLVSGYGEPSPDRMPAAAAFLQKPIELAPLSAALRGVLDAAATLRD